MQVKKYFLLGVMVAMMLLPAYKVQAAEKSCKVPLGEEGKNYYIDLDGDNKAEKIRYEKNYIEDSEGNVLGNKLTLYVNNQAKTIKRTMKGHGYAEWDVSIYNFNTNDKYKEIEIYSDCSGNIIHDVYRYQGKKIQKYFSMPKSWLKQGIRIYDIQPGNGKITMYVPYRSDWAYPHIGCFDCKINNGTVKRIGKKDEYYLNAIWLDNDFYWIKKMEVKKKLNESEISFILTGEDVLSGFEVKKLHAQNNKFTDAYIKLYDGRSGWISFSSVSEYDSLDQVGVDLNGKDTLRFDEQENIYINDTLIYDKSRFQIIDYDEKDKYKELLLIDNNGFATAYRCKNGLMDEVFKFNFNNFEDAEDFFLDGKKRISFIFYFSGVSYVKNYKIVDKELKSIDSNNTYNCMYYDGYGYNSFYATDTIQVQKSLKNNKTKFQLKFGDSFTAQKVYIDPDTEQRYVYIRTEKGKTGWVKWTDHLSIKVPGTW